MDKTNIPLPFRCVYAAQVKDAERVEKLLHDAFDDARVRAKREFFELSPKQAIAALKLAGGKDVTPHKDIAHDEEGVEALNRATVRQSNISMAKLGILPGSLLTHYEDETITAEVIDDRRIRFEGKETSLSAAALIVLHRQGFGWQSARGALYWSYNGETLAERRSRMEDEELNAH